MVYFQIAIGNYTDDKYAVIDVERFKKYIDNDKSNYIKVDAAEVEIRSGKIRIKDIIHNCHYRKDSIIFFKDIKDECIVEGEFKDEDLVQ